MNKEQMRKELEKVQLSVGERVAAVRALQAYIEQALEEYEFRGDPGDYTPNEQESMLIHDCAQGLVADQEFIQLVAALALPYDAILAHQEKEPAKLTDDECYSILNKVQDKTDEWAANQEVEPTEQQIAGVFISNMLLALPTTPAAPAGQAIAVVRSHGDYQATIEWLLNPLPDGTLLCEAASLTEG